MNKLIRITEDGKTTLTVENEELVIQSTQVNFKPVFFTIESVYDLLESAMSPDSPNIGIARRAKQMRQHYPEGVAPDPFNRQSAIED